MLSYFWGTTNDDPPKVESKKGGWIALNQSGSDGQKIEEGWFEVESHRTLQISTIVPQSVRPVPVVSTLEVPSPQSESIAPQKDHLRPEPVTTPVSTQTTTATSSKPPTVAPPPSLFETVVQRVSFQSAPVPPAPKPERVQKTEPVRFVVWR